MRFLSPYLVPAARTLMVAAVALSLGACRSSLTAPSIDPDPAAADAGMNLVMPATTPPIASPLGIRAVHVNPDGHDLVVSIRYVRPLSGGPGYDPFTPGGWCFQVFLDTDQQPTGYLGYDFLTRDTEPDLAGREIRVRRTTGGLEGNPGGWGDAVDVVPLVGRDARLLFRIPLSALDGDDGRANYRVEFYRAVDCEECGGISYEYVFHVSGTTGFDRPLLVHQDRLPRQGLLARLAPGS
jgi:hypothetical protein